MGRRQQLIGALVVGLLAYSIFYRLKRVPLSRALDVIVVAIPLGQAIGRLGCLAAGCCYGKITTSPLALILPDASGFWAPRYPTQLQAARGSILTFFILLGLERWLQRQAPTKKQTAPLSRRQAATDGWLFWAYILLYSTQRLAVETLRETPNRNSRTHLGPPLHRTRPDPQHRCANKAVLDQKPGRP